MWWQITYRSWCTLTKIVVDTKGLMMLYQKNIFIGSKRGSTKIMNALVCRSGKLYGGVGNPLAFLLPAVKGILSNVKHYFWEDPFLYKLCTNLVVRRCVTHVEGWKILENYHSGIVGGHFSANRTAKKVLEAGFFWLSLFGDARRFVETCD